MTDEDLSEIMELIYHEPAAYLLPSDRAALALMLEQYPGLEKVFRDLLARDNARGTVSACSTFEELIVELSSIMSYTRDPKDWRINVVERDAEPAELLVRAWAVGSVRGDLGSGYFKGLTDAEVLDGFIDMRIMMYGDASRPDHSTDTDYWRGMAVLRPIYVEIDYDFEVLKERDEVAHRFALWAGTHGNVGLAADIAVARCTLDTDLIDAVIAQSALAPAVGDGAL